MTVNELIDKLLAMPGDMEVEVTEVGDVYDCFMTNDYNGTHTDKPVCLITN